MESLDEGAPEIGIDLDDDPFLPLISEDPDAWCNSVDKKVL